MGKLLEKIDSELAAWISEQRLFFVATAPLAATGHVNASPKGGDAFRVMGPLEVAYQDYTGSGQRRLRISRRTAESSSCFARSKAHPGLFACMGMARLSPRHSRFAQLSSAFPVHAGTRAFIHVSVTRVSSSCGQAFPLSIFAQTAMRSTSGRRGRMPKPSRRIAPERTDGASMDFRLWRRAPEKFLTESHAGVSLWMGAFASAAIGSFPFL
jgi:hypothetical protein